MSAAAQGADQLEGDCRAPVCGTGMQQSEGKREVFSFPEPGHMRDRRHQSVRPEIVPRCPHLLRLLLMNREAIGMGRKRLRTVRQPIFARNICQRSQQVTNCVPR